MKVLIKETFNPKYVHNRYGDDELNFFNGRLSFITVDPNDDIYKCILRGRCANNVFIEKVDYIDDILHDYYPVMLSILPNTKLYQIER